MFFLRLVPRRKGAIGTADSERLEEANNEEQLQELTSPTPAGSPNLYWYPS